MARYIVVKSPTDELSIMPKKAKDGLAEGWEEIDEVADRDAGMEVIRKLQRESQRKKQEEEEAKK